MSYEQQPIPGTTLIMFQGMSHSGLSSLSLSIWLLNWLPDFGGIPVPTPTPSTPLPYDFDPFFNSFPDVSQPQSHFPLLDHMAVEHDSPLSQYTHTPRSDDLDQHHLHAPPSTPLTIYSKQAAMLSHPSNKGASLASMKCSKGRVLDKHSVWPDLWWHHWISVAFYSLWQLSQV